MGSGFVDKRDKPFQSLYARNFVLFFSTKHICLNNSYCKYYFYYSTIYNSAVSINSAILLTFLLMKFM